MGNSNPAFVYLRDVLGLKGVPKGVTARVTSHEPPRKDGLGATPADDLESWEYDVAVRTSRSLTHDETALAEKMLHAIDCQKILWCTGEAATETDRAKAVVIFGEADVKLGEKILRLPDLATFFGADAHVRGLKKFAWEQLKKFKQAFFMVALIFFATFAGHFAHAQESSCVLQTTLDNVIGPASLDLIQRAKTRAVKSHCGAVLLLINTPGGNLQSTRYIVEEILNSPVPFLCYVYPPGGHAGSAGAIILQSCHLSGAAEGTNIGAATPIDETGANIPSDLRRKILNDTVAWVTSLARMRGRNTQFAEDIIRQAKAVSAQDALKLNAIEFVGTTPEEFLKFAGTRTLQLENHTKVQLHPGRIIVFEHDLRFQVMDILMNPQIAYLLLMGSLALLYFEITHPGFVAPGVLGGLGLIIALVAMHMMDVTWGAVLLILSGIGLLIGEAFMPTFGIVGLGGVAAFFMGSLFLFDYGTTGFALPLFIILPTVIFLGALLLGIAYLAFSGRKRKKLAGFGALVGRRGRISELRDGDVKRGYVEVDGELWRFESEDSLTIGQTVQIINHNGFTLRVGREQRS